MFDEKMFASLLANVMLSERSEMLAHYVGRGGRLHSLADCKATRKAGGPKNCVIHRPSLHRLTGSPQVLRSSGLIEDQCVHGVGHPNPDSAAYMDWRLGHEAGTWGTHGCDGCCGPVSDDQKRSRFEAGDISKWDDIEWRTTTPGWPPQDGGY